MLASLPEEEQKTILNSYTDDQLAVLYYDWHTWARPKQMAPPGDWYVWLLMAGRGFGKTRCGAGWTQERATGQQRWIAYVAKTPADARDFMIEGPGGILRNTHPEERPHYEPSKRRLTWPNGAVATIYSDEQPDQLRGFSGDTAWIDEFAKFKHPVEVWDNLQFGMREIGGEPRVFISTTPRPLRVLNQIKAMDNCITVTGSSYENRSNLHPLWFDTILSRYEGTRIGRQEIHAEMLTDNPEALWKRADIENNRVTEAPQLIRIVVAIDPQAKNKPDSSETGIVVAGIDQWKQGYVLDDLSIKTSPDIWAKEAITGYHKYKADRIIGETNNGGDMVELTVRTVDPNVPFSQVTASRGKETRAEPISALYEQGKVHHVGCFSDLEDQMCEWVPGMKSPDRIDALVWALTELMLTEPALQGMAVYEPDDIQISKY